MDGARQAHRHGDTGRGVGRGATRHDAPGGPQPDWQLGNVGPPPNSRQGLIAVAYGTRSGPFGARPARALAARKGTSIVRRRQRPRSPRRAVARDSWGWA